MNRQKEGKLNNAIVEEQRVDGAAEHAEEGIEGEVQGGGWEMVEAVEQQGGVQEAGQQEVGAAGEEHH